MTDEFYGPAGLVGPHRESHEPRLDATKFLTVSPVGGFLAWNGTQGVGERWGMDGNDKWGDCGAAATDHYNIAKTQNPHVVGTLGRPKYDGTLGTYFAYGLSMGEVGQPPEPPDEPDEGVDNKTWLGFLYTQGIIYGYGEVPLEYLDWFAQTAKGCILGLIIDGNQAISDFQTSPRTPWGAMPNASDGHDTLLIITNTDGSGSLVTWGAVQPFTPEFPKSDNRRVDYLRRRRPLSGPQRPASGVGGRSRARHPTGRRIASQRLLEESQRRHRTRPKGDCMSDEQGITDTTADESVGDALGTPGAEIEGHLEATVVEEAKREDGLGPDDQEDPDAAPKVYETASTEAEVVAPVSTERPLTPEQALNAVRPDAQ